MSELKPISYFASDPDFVKTLIALAEADGHNTFSPTHIVTPNGSDEILGMTSLGSVPLISVWMHSERSMARDSVDALRQGLAIARDRGWRVCALPVETSSPFYEYMEPLGFKNQGNYDFFTKEF